MTALSAAFYVDCSLNKFFNQLIHLSSEEGVSEIIGRVAGSYYFEIADAIKAFKNEDGSMDAEARGIAYGRAISVITNDTI